MGISVDEHKFVGVEERETKLRERVFVWRNPRRNGRPTVRRLPTRLQKQGGASRFGVRDRTLEGQQPRPRGYGFGRIAAFLEQAPSEVTGLLQRGFAVEQGERLRGHGGYKAPRATRHHVRRIERIQDRHQKGAALEQV